MKRFILCTFALIALVGCSGNSKIVTLNVDASVPYAASLDPLVGKWASEGELALIVDRQGDQIFIRNPKNDVWRFEVLNASATDTSITYTQKNYLIDGTYHPFNGEPCYSTISTVNGAPNSLKHTISTKLTPSESGILTRLPEDK